MMRRERRRRPVGLADDDGVAARDPVVLDRLGDGGGDVHHHVALAEREIHAGEPVERGRELAQPLRHRHVERGERALADRAGLFEAVAGLEAPDGGGDIGVEDVAAGVLGREIVGDGQALAQQRHLGTGRAGGELGDVRRQRRPAAADLQGRIAQHGGRDAPRGRLVVGRMRRIRDAGRRAGSDFLGLRLGLGLGLWPWASAWAAGLGQRRSGHQAGGENGQRERSASARLARANELNCSIRFPPTTDKRAGRRYCQSCDRNARQPLAGMIFVGSGPVKVHSR